MSRMEQIIARAGEVQPLPGTILHLIAVINDPRSSVDEIVETIRYDQALTTRMLRVCNSAYLGLSREVNSIEDAMRILGTLKVMQILMAIHTSALLCRRQEGYELEPGVLWKQSVATALACSLFCEYTRPPNPSLTFTAGLLHDVGKVVLNEYVAAEVGQIVALVRERKISFIEAEKQVLGFTSAEIGAVLAEKWNLPESIVRCIRYHRTPGELNPPDVLVDTVYLANCACLLFGVGLGTDGLCYKADATVMERYQLKENDIELVGAQMLFELQRVQAMFKEDALEVARAASSV